MRPFQSTLRLLRRTAEPPGAADLSDARLLDRFLRGRDEAAFECLVWRHGRTVLGVCRRVLADHHAAEDAFQATFLALARNGQGVGGRGSVGGWLARVAYRAALARRARPSRHEQPLEEEPAATGDPVVEAARRELRALVDEEVRRLPERFRLPVVLCHFAGHTNAEAARLLGCAVGTVESRLTRARQRLRVALLRRGVAPAGLAAGLASSDAPSAVPAGWVADAVRAAVTDGGSVPVGTTILTQEVLRTMSSTRIRAGSLALAAVAVIAVAAGGWALAGSGQDRPPAKPAGGQPEAKPAAPAELGVQTFAGVLRGVHDHTLALKGPPGQSLNRERTAIAGWLRSSEFSTRMLLPPEPGGVEMQMESGVITTRITLPKEVRYTLNGKECTADDLQEGMLVSVRIDKGPQGDPRARVNALTRDPQFLVKAVDAAKRSVRLVVPGSRAPVLEYTLPESAAVRSGDKPLTLGELKPRTKVALELADDGTTVRGLRVVAEEERAFAP
jgi:RNA polymerase sigma factor (sigma-70 family)